MTKNQLLDRIDHLLIVCQGADRMDPSRVLSGALTVMEAAYGT